MPERLRRRRSTRRKTTRWIAAAIVLCSAMSCVAPVLYASDCSRWIAEYKQGLLQRRAARRLRAAKYRLTTLIRPAHPVHRHPLRRPMGPLEALRRFQVDCGDLEGPPVAPRLTSLPVLPTPLAVEFPPVLPPELPAPSVVEVAEGTPPLTLVPPLTDTPPASFPSVPVPGPVPEPASILLVLTGAAGTIVQVRRRHAAAVRS